MNQKADGRSAKSRRFKELHQTLANEFSDLKPSASVAAFIDQATTLTLESERLQNLIKAGKSGVGNDAIRVSNALARILGLLRSQRDQLKPKPSTAMEQRKSRPGDTIWEGLNTFRYLSEPEVFTLGRLADQVDGAGSLEALLPEQQMSVIELRDKAKIRPPQPSDRMWLDIDRRLPEQQRVELSKLSDAVDEAGGLSKITPDQLARIREILAQVVRIRDKDRPNN
jgi:hypothetical protein